MWIMIMLLRGSGDYCVDPATRDSVCSRTNPSFLRKQNRIWKVRLRLYGKPKDNTLGRRRSALADFCYGFTKSAGLTPWSHKDQQAWNFDPILIGLDLQKATWNKIIHEPWWWANLPLLPTAKETEALERLHENPHYQHVFCTNREGTPNAQAQTRKFIADYFWVDAAVVLSKRKGDVAKAINADYAIDDKAENVACIHWISDVQPTKAYILDRPYNRVPLPKRVRRVYSVEEFIADVEADK